VIQNLPSPENRLIWVDIETTGLDCTTEVMIEVGFMLTDLNLNLITGVSTSIWMPNYEKAIDRADSFVKEMHEKSGAFESARNRGIPIDEAYDHVETWLDMIDVTKDEPLAGSSVQFDREWLTYLWPSLMRRFSYRNVDISSVKELCKRYNPELAKRLDEEVAPAKAHRVLSDINDTIDEFKFYRDEFLLWRD
jgi:oligoribonuclease